MEELVDLATVKRHLRITDTSQDIDLQLKLDQAHAIVLSYIARPDDDEWAATIADWTDETVPGNVQTAILLQAGELYRFRGDDSDPPRREPGYLSPAVDAFLRRYRRAVLA